MNYKAMYKACGLARGRHEGESCYLRLPGNPQMQGGGKMLLLSLTVSQPALLAAPAALPPFVHHCFNFRRPQINFLRERRASAPRVDRSASPHQRGRRG